MLRSLRGDRERGAAIVEFAVVMPLLVLLVFGIIESGWYLAQQVEVRHGAREGARTAAVSAPDTSGNPLSAADVVQATCDRMDLSNGTATVTLTAGGSDIGDTARIVVVSNYEQLTGLLPFEGSIDTSVDFRLEQPRTWSPISAVSCS